MPPMPRSLKVSILPAVVALAAFFSVLPRTGADATVRMVRSGDGWRFDPAVRTVASGQRVAFVNDSTVTHTASCAGCPWDTGDVQPGQTAFITVPSGGPFRYRCRYHESIRMTGELVTPGGTPPPGATAPSPVASP